MKVKLFSQLCVLVSIYCSGVCYGAEGNMGSVTDAQNQEMKKKELQKKSKDENEIKLPDFAVVPTAKTLPKGIFKADVPLAYTFGNSGFNNHFERKENGFEIRRVMSAVVLQYGITDSLSFGLGLPYTIHNGLQMNGDKFRKSDFLKRYLNKAISDVEANAPTVLCSGNPCTRQYILNGGTAAANAPIYLPTGEIGTIIANQPIIESLENIITTAAEPKEGVNDIGDLQLGFLWNLVSPEDKFIPFPIYFSWGMGLRVPTGKFNVAGAFRQTGGDGTLSTGGGTVDGILRTNVDYAFSPAAFLSWQNQVEYSFTDADFSRSSMTNPENFSSANPNNGSGDKGYADTVSNQLTFSRQGVRIYGMAQYALGLGTFAKALKVFGVYSQLKYNIAAKTLLNGKPIYVLGDQFYLKDDSVHPDNGREQFYSAVMGFKINGLPVKFPLELSTEFEYPLIGSNRLVSPMNVMSTLSLYF